jgi:hypothetical protein
MNIDAGCGSQTSGAKALVFIGSDGTAKSRAFSVRAPGRALPESDL